MVCPCCAPSCNCGSGRKPYPSAIAVTFNVGECAGDGFTASCADCARLGAQAFAHALLNGTHILSRIGDSFGSMVYTNGFPAGGLALTVLYCCTNDCEAIHGNGYLDWSYCNDTASGTNYVITGRRSFKVFDPDLQPRPAFPIPALCSLGNVLTFSEPFGVQVGLRFSVSCGGQPPAGCRYLGSITVEIIQ